jgi:hypothetical protein
LFIWFLLLLVTVFIGVGAEIRCPRKKYFRARACGGDRKKRGEETEAIKTRKRVKQKKRQKKTPKINKEKTEKKVCYKNERESER